MMENLEDPLDGFQHQSKTPFFVPVQWHLRLECRPGGRSTLGGRFHGTPYCVAATSRVRRYSSLDSGFSALS